MLRVRWYCRDQEDYLTLTSILKDMFVENGYSKRTNSHICEPSLKEGLLSHITKASLLVGDVGALKLIGLI